MNNRLDDVQLTNHQPESTMILGIYCHIFPYIFWDFPTFSNISHMFPYFPMFSYVFLCFPLDFGWFWPWLRWISSWWISGRGRIPRPPRFLRNGRAGAPIAGAEIAVAGPAQPPLAAGTLAWLQLRPVLCSGIIKMKIVEYIIIYIWLYMYNIIILFGNVIFCFFWHTKCICIKRYPEKRGKCLFWCFEIQNTGNMPMIVVRTEWCWMTKRKTGAAPYHHSEDKLPSGYD